MLDVTAEPSTPALAYLAERQRGHPPRYARRGGADRAQQLCGVLEPELPEPLQALLRTGAVAVGEVGIYVPDVRTIPVASEGLDGFVIEFTTGMMDFNYAVGRALAGVDMGQTRSDSDGREALELPGVVALVAGVFQEWARHSRWSWLLPRRRVKHVELAVADSVRQWIEMLATTAELFMLARELGHVALDRGLCPPLSENVAEDADRYGLQFFLPAAEKRVGLRRAYAGAVFAIRVFAGLERLGVRFSTERPPQAKRVELLRTHILSRTPSRQYFHEISTIMEACQDVMDDVDNHIDRRSPSILRDAEQTVVLLIAQLEDLTRGRAPQSEFVEDFVRIARRTPPDTLRRACTTLVEYYLPPWTDESYVSPDLRIQMASALVAVVDALPEHLRKLFPIGGQAAAPPMAPDVNDATLVLGAEAGAGIAG